MKKRIAKKDGEHLSHTFSQSHTEVSSASRKKKMGGGPSDKAKQIADGFFR